MLALDTSSVSCVRSQSQPTRDRERHLDPGDPDEAADRRDLADRRQTRREVDQRAPLARASRRASGATSGEKKRSLWPPSGSAWSMNISQPFSARQPAEEVEVALAVLLADRSSAAGRVGVRPRRSRSAPPRITDSAAPTGSKIGHEQVLAAPPAMRCRCRGSARWSCRDRDREPARLRALLHVDAAVLRGHGERRHRRSPGRWPRAHDLADEDLRRAGPGRSRATARARCRAGAAGGRASAASRWRA